MCTALANEVGASAKPLPVATVLDGGEEYGLAQAIANLADAYDRRCVRPIGIFLGRGHAQEMLTARFPEARCLETGPLIPLRPVGRPRFDPIHICGRLNVLRR